MAERLCSVAVDWEVSGSILTGPSPRVLNNWEEASRLVFCTLVPLKYFNDNIIANT